MGRKKKGFLAELAEEVNEKTFNDIQKIAEEVVTEKKEQNLRPELKVAEENKILREAWKKRNEPNKMAFTDDYENYLKHQLFKQEIESLDLDEEESEYYTDLEVKEKDNDRKGLWDYTKEDEILFFDPDKSYEITGYRPINETEGLDFDPAPFMETGRIYTETGAYTEYPKGSKPYADFWREQLKRCAEGLTIGKYRITGDHYFFLNFYRMKIVDDTKKAGMGSDEGFPNFIVEQYKFFHYYEMCEYLKKDVIALKSRGIGWSEIGASMGVRPFITTRNFRSVYVANSDLFVDGVLDKCWWQLNWLNNNTNGGMKRARQKIDNIKQKRASRVDKEGQEYGRMAEIEGIVADNPRKVRGDRVDRLMFEESGSFKMLRTAWVQGEALVTVAGARKGIRSAWGCVCAGTVVYKADGTPVLIENLKQEDGILGYKNGIVNKEPISYMQEEAYKPCVRITIVKDNLWLDCSEDHPIYAVTEKKKVGKDFEYKFEFVEAKDVMKKAIYLAAANELDIWGNDYLIDPYKFGKTFMEDKEKNIKILGKHFMQLRKSDAIDFLTGLFDGYGQIRVGISIRIVLKDDRLARYVSFLFRKLGIWVSNRCEGREEYSSFSINLNDTQSIYYFQKYIHLKDRLKAYKFQKICKFMKFENRFKSDIRMFGIRSVESLGVQRIYNLTADDSHTYLANNIITHNTGGDSDSSALAGLTEMFNDPNAYNILPYKNHYSDDGSEQMTGYFIPAYNIMLASGFTDKRGVTDIKKAKAYYEEQRQKKSGQALLEYCAEYCFTPSEALLKQGDGIFDPIVIADRLTQIRIQKIGIKPQRVDLVWDCPNKDQNPRSKVKMLPNQNSKIFIYEPPLKDDNGNGYSNLYVAGIDSIDQGTGDSSTQSDVSDFCIVIKRRVLGTKSATYVAMYKDRPKDIATAYENAMKLLVLYNCKAMLEHTKIGIIMYFRSKKKENLFMKRPKSTLSDIKRGNSEMIGYPAQDIYLKHGIELIINYINDFCYDIHIDEMLEQLLKYSWEQKRKFDIVAAMIAAELGDEDMVFFKPKTKDEASTVWRDFGYYTDSHGRKMYGVIPQRRW